VISYFNIWGDTGEGEFTGRERTGTTHDLPWGSLLPVTQEP